MRIVCTLTDLKQGHTLSSFLTKEGIENQLDVITNTDWGSSEYGDTLCKIWVIDEDQVDPAMRWIEEFQKNPQNPVFSDHLPKIKTEIESLIGTPKENALKMIKAARRTPQAVDRQPLGTLTLYFVILCCILYAISEMTAPPRQSIPSFIPAIPVFASPIEKSLFFDYPYAYEIIDRIVALYGIGELQSPQDLPSEGQNLLQQFYNTPYWQGLYEQVLQRLKNPAYEWNFSAPLFEKIRQGEVWRLFTPCVLHSDLLHLFFNMIWLVVLGKQIEQRMGKRRYLVFILVTGILTNIAQYLMGGANFIGFSGILCAMLTFIWMRQKRAAWEGYQLQGVTMAFMMFFILTMFLIQAVSFSLEVYHQISVSPGIANTAHLTGAVLGILLARFDFFSSKP